MEALDLAIVERCCRGDPAAWTAFLPHFEQIGLRSLRTFSLSKASRKDVLADVLTEFYDGGLRRFRGDSIGQLVNFIRRAVRNRALDVVRESRRHVELDATAESKPDQALDTAEAQCQEFLRAEVEKLPRAARELYLMRARGLREREIAEQTGRPLGTIAAQVARLIDRLRQRLATLGCLNGVARNRS